MKAKDFIGVMRLFLGKHLPETIKESKNELMCSFGKFLIIFAGVMLFFFCIFGLLLNPIAFYVYVLIMAVIAFFGVIFKALFEEVRESENEDS